MTPTELPPVLPGNNDVSEGHEKKFRATFELRDDLKGDPHWEAAFEYAATSKLTFPEMSAIGAAVVRKATPSNGLAGPELKSRLDSLSAGAKDWLDQTCHRLADGQGYTKSPIWMKECLDSGLIEKKGRYIEASGEVMDLVYSESYFRTEQAANPDERVGTIWVDEETDTGSSLRKMTDQWIESGEYCQQTVIDLRDRLIEAVASLRKISEVNDKVAHDVFDYETRTKEAVSIAEKFLEDNKL